MSGDTHRRAGRRSSIMALAFALALALALVAPQPAEAAGLEWGARSNLVAHLQSELADVGFYRGPIDGAYGPMTAQAVMAFHKHLGLERSFDWGSEDWRHLRSFEPIEHRGRPGIVIDLDRQVLYLHRVGGSVAVIPVSSANGEPYIGRAGRPVTARTPTGDFSLYRHVPGERVSYLGSLWKPWYFYGGYAIHGSSSVPAHPASHGCVRVPNWEANWFDDELHLGMSVSVIRSGGVAPPTLEPLPEPDRDRILRLAR